MATIKQKEAVKKLVGNGGNITQAMISAGYSPETANTPQKLTESKGFQELMKEAKVTDKRLLDKLNKGLDATRTIVLGTKSEESFVDIQPDWPTIYRFTELGFKLKGHLRSTEANVTNNLTQVNINADPTKTKDLRDRFTQFLEAETISE